MPWITFLICMDPIRHMVFHEVALFPFRIVLFSIHLNPSRELSIKNITQRYPLYHFFLHYGHFKITFLSSLRIIQKILIKPRNTNLLRRHPDRDRQGVFFPSNNFEMVNKIGRSSYFGFCIYGQLFHHFPLSSDLSMRSPTDMISGRESGRM
jgi:hypothetical protein